MRCHSIFSKRVSWSFTLIATTLFAMDGFSQQPGNQGGVAPRTPGYGAGAAGGNRPANPNPPQNAGNRPSTGTNPAAGNPNPQPGNGLNGQPNAAGPNGQAGQQPDAQFNPQLNARAQSKVEQAVRDSQQWQMQGPNNGGQIIAEPPFPALTPDEQKYVDQMLLLWQQKTADITRFSCDFKRWEYDSQEPGVAAMSQKIGRPDIVIAAGSGVIRYQKPDKGLFKVENYLKWTGGVTANNQPELKKDDKKFGEWVICDSQYVWDYDTTAKTCTQLELPPNMRGIGIMNSPLPFLFGVKADEIKTRYWVRAISPGTNRDGSPIQDKYAIEAYPKFPVDAVNYHHVQVWLDKNKYLPVMMVLYMPEWSDKEINQNGLQIPARDKKTIFEFDNHQLNAGIFQRLTEKLFNEQFIPHEPPADWKKNVIPYIPEQEQKQQVPAQQASAPTQPGALTQPSGQPPVQNKLAPVQNGQRTANPGLPTSPANPRPR